ncbi:ABC transporter substrate-binding protein [Actinokineospora sp. 24-640]
MNTIVPAEEHIVWPVTEWGIPQFHAYVLVAHRTAVERDPVAMADLVAVAERGYRTAAEDPQLVVREFEQITPYFGPDLLTRSLRSVSPTWIHAGRWGEPRAALLEPYARWLARWGLLENSEVWKSSCTTEFLDRSRRNAESVREGLGPVPTETMTGPVRR